MAGIKLKPKARKGIISIKALVKHPMETGLRKKKGKVVPMNHIESLQILNNGEVVIDTEVGSSISKNPYFKFQIHGKKGDSITLNFTDTSGKKGSSTKKSK